MEIIGITGNSGSGKSVVSQIIRKKGGYIIDADKIAHMLMLKGNAAYEEITAEFGSGILDEKGQINRKKLGDIVFSDKASLDKLNSITHKYIVQYIKDELKDEIKKKHLCIVIDAPLLFETELDRLCTWIWVVCADKETKLKRICERDDISEEQAEKRLSRQTSDEEYRKKADIITDNSRKNIPDLVKEIEAQLLKITNKRTSKEMLINSKIK